MILNYNLIQGADFVIKKNALESNSRKALDQLENEFSKELIINNPNAGITTKKLVEMTKKQSIGE